MVILVLLIDWSLLIVIDHIDLLIDFPLSREKRSFIITKIANHNLKGAKITKNIVNIFYKTNSI